MMTSPGAQEFYQIIRALDARSQRKSLHAPIFATVGRCLWQRDVSVAEARYACTVYALSPSDVSILLAHQHIASLLPQEKVTKLRVPALTPNHAAVVLWINIGEAFILLGSDLEETGHQGTGWSVILGSSTYPRGKASVFKIPHHGSQTADHPQIWQDMLDAKPYAILTPFALGSVSLPARQDVDRICARTAQAYTTAIPRHRRRRDRPHTVEKTLRETVRSIREGLPAGHRHEAKKITASMAKQA
jgi:hypothetical protein